MDDLASPVEHLIGYFGDQVLASYRNEADKYIIKTDNFCGTLETTEECFLQLEDQDVTDGYIRVRFGYRTLESEKIAIAAFLPDLRELSENHQRRWAAFHLVDPQWTKAPDRRFQDWVDRYLNGSWEVESGPLIQLQERIETINALTAETVGMPLFKSGLSNSLPFPAAENTHRYEDAHAELYRYLIDGLDRNCVQKLAEQLNRTCKSVSDKKTLTAVKKVFPVLHNSASFNAAFDLVSEQRRKATHQARHPAAPFGAFEQFTNDLWKCVEALKVIVMVLEQELGINGIRAMKRQESKRYLPTIVGKAEPRYSICQADRMRGKTVSHVEYGFKKLHPNGHRSEALIIHFTDGSILGIDTASNFMNVSAKAPDLRPNDFHVDFSLQWVPEP